jgi:hypothetical protein
MRRVVIALVVVVLGGGGRVDAAGGSITVLLAPPTIQQQPCSRPVTAAITSSPQPVLLEADDARECAPVVELGPAAVATGRVGRLCECCGGEVECFNVVPSANDTR